MKRKYILCLAVFFMSVRQSQSQPDARDYKTQPLWISMIDNPSTNYYEAVKAYSIYWAHHTKPVNREELMREGAKKVQEYEQKHQSELADQAVKALVEEQEMTYQCKRFEQWKRDVLPFVQNDGRILNEEERLRMYQQNNSSEK